MNTVLDSSWVKSAFMLPADAAILGKETLVSRIYSTSMQQAGDTTPGGCMVINPLAQFTRYADLKHNVWSTRKSANGKTIGLKAVGGIVNRTSTHGNGMGRVYHEKFYENYQVVHFRMGVPMFNSMTSFYANYYNVAAATMARTGRAPGFFYKLGWAIGSIATIPLMPFVFAGKVIKFFLRRPASKYYYMRPTMYPYWSGVSAMVNGVAANAGIIPRPLYDGAKALFDKNQYHDESDVKAFHAMLPSVYRENGGLDVYAIAQRAQRLVNARRDVLDNKLSKMTDPVKIREAHKSMLYGDDLSEATRISSSGNPSTLEAYRNLWLENARLGKLKDESETGMLAEPVESDPRTITGEGALDEGAISEIEAAFNSERKMGSEFVSFRVDYTGTQSESFNNSTKEPSIQATLNNMSASARETRFSIFDGNVTTGVGEIYDAFKSLIAGGTQALGIQGLAQLAGSAFVDIPKVWDSSSCDFNKLTLNIPLRSPYGHPIARLQNLILPMCCLFGMAVPLATGKQSHTSPFLIEYFAQGRAHSRLAMVDSLTFTRGVGDVGWNNTGNFLGVDCQLGLIDLSNSINMPLQPAFDIGDTAVMAAGYGAGALTGAITGSDTAAQTGQQVASAMLGSTYDDDNNYTDYLAILAGLPLEAELNGMRKWAIRLARQQARFDDAKSINRMVMYGMSTTPGEVIKAVSMAGDKG